MRLSVRCLVVVLMTSIVAGCGQVDPVLLTVNMPGCIYQGPPTISPGNARLSLRVNGLADVGTGLVRLTGERSYSDLVDHFEMVDGQWAERPDWTNAVMEIRLDSGEGSRTAQETRSLRTGSYAVVCLEYPANDEPQVAIAARLEVREN